MKQKRSVSNAIIISNQVVGMVMHDLVDHEDLLECVLDFGYVNASDELQSSSP